MCLLVFSGGIKWDNLPKMDQSYVLTLLWQRSLSYRFAEQIDWLASNDRDLCCERINLFKILASKKSISTSQKNPIKLYSGKRNSEQLICDNDNNRTKMKKHIFYLRGGCLYDTKPNGYSPVKQVPRLVGMILIFIYMRSFVLVCRDENVTWYCFEFSLIWF